MRWNRNRKSQLVSMKLKDGAFMTFFLYYPTWNFLKDHQPLKKFCQLSFLYVYTRWLLKDFRQLCFLNFFLLVLCLLETSKHIFMVVSRNVKKLSSIFLKDLFKTFKNLFNILLFVIPTTMIIYIATSQMIKTTLIVHHFQIFGNPKYMFTYNAQP
jgi:hypothetical protein